ncbi:MAG: T9SS type A sorting domain-containing protein [Saprospiraceae bacterium]|nr:T9SS type A sorting domain-containing protein [Saprospiraceae bacterium]
MNYILLPLLLLLPAFASLHAQPGSLDTSFDPGSGANNTVFAMTVQPDGKILIGGRFTSYNGAPRNYIARLNADGSLDAGFDPGSGANSLVYAIAVQPDGKILIGGIFTSYNGAPRNGIARLNSDGSLDTGFGPGSGANDWVWAMAVQPDGKILIGGLFTSYNGAPRNRIARLNADGSLDTDFDPGSGATSDVQVFAVLPAGKILIGGGFTTYNGAPRNRIARLNSDGSLDTSFGPGNGANNSLYIIALQPDGKILIGGFFSTYNGAPRNRIARLNSDGSLDTGFDPGAGADSGVAIIAAQPDGRILIGGDFTSYNETARNYIARLNSDGSLDTGFDPGTGADGAVLDMAVQPDAKILIGGAFTNYNGVLRNQIARLNGDLSSSVTDIDKTEIQLFPNPTTGRLHLTNIRADRVQVYDNTGRLMRYISQPVSELDLSGLSAGVYFLKITEGNVVYSARVVKQ